MKTITMSTYTYIPDAVLKAFVHVQSHFPNLKKVEYNSDGHWKYINSDGSTPSFDDKIDVSLLESASDSAYSVGYPVCFTLA